MDHPNIAKVLDGGMTESGRPYFVMEYGQGRADHRVLRRGPAERLASGWSCSCRSARPCSTPIRKGIIHRDLKPSNILVALYDGQPVPKVIDFGLAKAMHQPLTEHTLYTAHEPDGRHAAVHVPRAGSRFNNLDVDTRSRHLFAGRDALRAADRHDAARRSSGSRTRPGTRSCGSSARRSRRGPARD